MVFRKVSRFSHRNINKIKALISDASHVNFLNKCEIQADVRHEIVKLTGKHPSFPPARE